MPVLHGLSIEVRRAEIVALVGSNGAGKTTLLRVLSRLLPCTGTLRFNGQDLAAMTPDQAFGHGLQGFDGLRDGLGLAAHSVGTTGQRSHQQARLQTDGLHPLPSALQAMAAKPAEQLLRAMGDQRQAQANPQHQAGQRVIGSENFLQLHGVAPW